MDFSDLRNNYTQYLKDISDSISVEQLRIMTQDKNREIREFSYLLLINTKQLGDEEIESLSASEAQMAATVLTLYGERTFPITLILFLFEIIYPSLRPASPNAFENVCMTNKLSYFLISGIEVFLEN